jgi:hypothetical protein
MSIGAKIFSAARNIILHIDIYQVSADPENTGMPPGNFAAATK